MTPEIGAWANLELKLYALRRVVSALAARGIAALPVKGILLAPLLYPNLLERPLVDVDILIRPGDLRGAIRVARAAHWPLVWDSRQVGNVNFLVDGTPVDVAASMGPPGSSALGVSTLLSRSTVQTRPLGVPHHQIEWHDHVLLMALDTFKDKLDGKPSAREDLLRMARAPVFAPEALVAAARRAELTTMLSIVADWMLTEPSPPWERVRKLLPDPHWRPTYVRAFKSLAASRPRDRRPVALAIVTRAVSDSFVRRLSALALGGVGVVLQQTRSARRG